MAGKRFLHLGLTVAVLATVFSIGLRAQSKPAQVSGRYEGWARGTPDGDVATVVVLEQKDSGLSGTMTAGSYSLSVYEGKLAGEKITWSFSDGSVTGSVEGTFKAGVINGQWWAGGAGGALELKRAAAR